MSSVGWSIPTQGKLYLICSLGLSLLVFTQSIDPYSISYTFKTTIFELDLYRPFTAILYLGRVQFLLVLKVILTWIVFSRGNKVWKNNKADFLWLFVVITIILTFFSTFSSMYFYGTAFIMTILTMWAIQNPTEQLNLKYFMMPLIYLPFLSALVLVLFGSSFKNYLFGFLAGLLLGIIKGDNFTSRYGQVLPTPAIIQNIFQQNLERVNIVEEPARSASSSAGERGAYFRGQGHRIG